MNNLKKTSGLSLFLLGGLVLAGCQSPIQPLGKMNASFGNSVKQNMAAQIVDPEASKDITEAPTLDGNKANTAIRRYQEGEVKEVKEVKTTKVGAN